MKVLNEAFDIDDMDNEIAKYEAELAENQLLLDHCKKMIALKSKMYDEDSVKSVEQDISVCSGYLEELKKKKESYSIKAEGHGVIGLVSNALSYGHVDSSDTLLSISYGSGCFYADTDDPFAFEIGKIYTGVNGAAEYKMKLVSIVEPKDNPDSDKRRLTFEYQTVDGEIPIFDSMDMVIEKNILKNVTYVTEDAVLHGEDGNDYLSVVGEDGFGYQRAIKVDSYVDGYAIISEGVESGERVIIQ